MAQLGRPTKYTEQLGAAICERVRGGATFRDACAAERVSEDSFARWRARYADFAERLLQAEAECACDMAELLRLGAMKDPRFAVEWLKRRRRDEWGDNLKAEHSGQVGIIGIREVIVERPQEPADA